MTKKASKKDAEEMSLDFGAAKEFFQNIDWKKLSVNGAVILLILIPLFLSVFFRVQPAYLPATDNWAQQAVFNSVRNDIRNQVNQQYPNLPSQNKEELVNQQFQQLIEDRGSELQNSIDQTSQQFKTRLQDDEGQTYLLAIDPYFYFRKVRNKVETGHYYDEIRMGLPWNTHVIAPLGKPFDINFHTQISYWTHKFISMINPDIPIMTTFFFIPVIFAALAVIPAFFIARRKAGNLGGFVAATLVAVHTSFLGRTAAGFSDTDAYNVFFPLLITWLFLEAFEAEDRKKQITLASLAGVTTGIFSHAWSGWWYLFDFSIAVLIGYFIYSIIKRALKKQGLKNVLSSKSILNTIYVGIPYILFSGIFVTLITNFNNFIRAPLQPLGFRIIKQAAHANLWPNVYTTVAELGDTSIAQIVNLMGGKLLFFIALLGVILTMVSKEGFKTRDWVIVVFGAVFSLLLISDNLLRMNQLLYLALFGLPLAVGLLLTLNDDRDIDVKYAMFLTVWFIGTIYATTKGVRFTLVLVPAFAVAFGIAIGMLRDLFTKAIQEGMSIKDGWVSPVVTILLLLLLVGPINSAAAHAPNEVPSMNDAWYNSLTKIKQESQPDAIINSWWDFGHWFKAIADRAVTFDGGSQNTPMAHWIGKSLVSGDEDTTVGILRMLDCGSNNAFEAVRSVTNDTVESVNILNEIIVLDEEGARESLEDRSFSESDVDNVLSLTHCEPPENYYITSEDMVGKAGVWSHFGTWNFERAMIYTALQNQPVTEAVDYMTENFGYTEDQASNLYYQAIELTSENQANQWISPWPRYVTSGWSGCSETNETISCNLGRSIGQQNGQHIVIEQVIVNKTQTPKVSMSIGAYDAGTGQRVGGNMAVPRNLFLAGEDEIEQFNLNASNFQYSVLVDDVNNRIMMMDEELGDATFTKLFYLDGRYMDHFEKFSDQRGVNGQRIIVWKVDWDGSN